MGDSVIVFTTIAQKAKTYFSGLLLSLSEARHRAAPDEVKKMKSSITLSELVAIYEQYDLTLSDKAAEETLAQCNEQADEIYLKYGVGEPLPSRSASEWAHYFASGVADEIMCDAMSAADFNRNAYGE